MPSLASESVPRRAPPAASLARLVLITTGLVVGVPAAAHAQSSRAAHAVGLFVDQPAILTGSDRAFLPQAPEGAVTVCAHASGACRPIRSVEPCQPEICPGSGVLVRLDGSLPDVGDYPTDRDGMQREWNAIAADPRVASLLGALRQPPPPQPSRPPTFHLDDGQWRFELTVGGGAGYRPEVDVGMGSLAASFGVRFGYDWDDEEILEALFGNSLGVDVRARVLPSVLGTSFEDLSVAVGIAAHTTFAPDHELFRFGAGYFTVIPELGVITRPDLDPAFYFGWSFPLSFALDTHVGLEARAWVWAVDDWIEGDEVGWVLGLDAALVLF